MMTSANLNTNIYRKYEYTLFVRIIYLRAVVQFKLKFTNCSVRVSFISAQC